MGSPKWAFCHGWYLDECFCEVTCRRRERCAYYDEDFYMKHKRHLEDFEELFPQEPCSWFVERKDLAGEPQGTVDGKDFLFIPNSIKKSLQSEE